MHETAQRKLDKCVEQRAKDLLRLQQKRMGELRRDRKPQNKNQLHAQKGLDRSDGLDDRLRRFRGQILRPRQIPTSDRH